MLDKKFFESRRRFIAQFDGLVPKNGAQTHIKKLSEQYSECLTSLEAAQADVVKLFSLGEVNREKMERHEKYPLAINSSEYCSIYHSIVRSSTSKKSATIFL